jgi:hypothetical protein
VPRVDEETRREFEQFKAQQAASKSDMFKKQDIQELRQFSQNIESKLSRSLGKESKMPSQPLAAGGAVQEEVVDAPAAQQEAAAGEAGAAVAAGGEQAAGAEAPKKSSLNPFAKSFNFNPNAKEFKPTFAAPAGGGLSAAAPAAAAAATTGSVAQDGGPAAFTAGVGLAGGPPATGASASPSVAGSSLKPASPMRVPGQAGIPMPDMRPDFRRMPRGDGSMDGPHPGRPERDGSFGRGRRDESRERGNFDRRRDGRHFEGGPGMRGGDGPPPPPPGKGPGSQGMQASLCLPPLTIVVRL